MTWRSSRRGHRKLKSLTIVYETRTSPNNRFGSSASRSVGHRDSSQKVARQFHRTLSATEFVGRGRESCLEPKRRAVGYHLNVFRVDPCHAVLLRIVTLHSRGATKNLRT